MSQDIKIYDVAIVGGGIVGAATAYKLQLHHPHLKIVLFEKEDSLAAHQTGRNSGVIHSGIYYKPGSYKAKNCVAGRKELVEFAKKYDIKHDVCGKIIVATHEKELPYLDKIFDTGQQNGIEGIEKISAQAIKDIEPYCEGIAGIYVPVTGIIDFKGATNRMVELMTKIQPESKVLLRHEVTAIHRSSISIVQTNKGNYSVKHLIFCGGLHADRLAQKDGVKLDMKIVGFRGDYYELTEQAKHKVKNLIYPVPNPEFPFLGVHFTRMVDGSIECGPNAVFTFKREGYNKTDFNLKDTLDALTFKGTWKLFFKHYQFGINEYKRAFSKKLFLQQLQRLIPSLQMDDIEEGRSGVRAMALDNNGYMIDDFKIEYANNAIHVLNAPSPAATASLAIGDQIREMAEKHFNLKN